MSRPDPSRLPSRPSAPAGSGVDAFIDAARAMPMPAPASASRGRLIFALDATMSRQPTWDVAMALQGRMFETTAALGGLDVQLAYFRGLNECRASRFGSAGDGLGRYMRTITCQGGNTQIGRILKHARDEARRNKVGALVYVGDAVEERVDPLCGLAGELALLGTKAFLFHEGQDPAAGRAFKEIARLTGGAYAAFDAAAPARLGDLLSAAAAYAAGGLPALEARSGAKDTAAARQLLSQLR